MVWDCLLISSKGELCAELCMFTKYLVMASAFSWSVVFVCESISGGMVSLFRPVSL